MRQTTNWQIPYPESPDHTRTWEYWQSIAERVDACLTTINNSVVALQTPPMCLVRCTADQNLPNGAWTPVVFQATDFDSHGMHPASGTRLTCKLAGTYLLSATTGAHQTVATGKKLAAVFRKTLAAGGAATDIPGQVNVPGAATNGVVPSAPATTVKLAVNDYVELYDYHDNGTAITGGNTAFAFALRVGN